MNFTDPAAMCEEIDAAIDFRDGYLARTQEILLRCAGLDFNANMAPPGEIHENLYMEIAANVLPGLTMGKPGFTVTSRVLDEMRLAAMNEGLAGWVEGSNFAATIDALGMDFLVGPCVTLTTVAQITADEDLDMPGGQLVPKVSTLAPSRVFFDPAGTSDDNLAFIGHVWVRDLDQLARAINVDGSPVFDPEILSELATDRDWSDMLQADRGLGMGRTTQRQQVIGYEVYHPDTRMIYTVGRLSGGDAQVTKQGRALRPPRPYRYGPQRGPYSIWGAFRIPGHVWPLSPFAVLAATEREMQAHLGKMAEDAAAAKRLNIVDSTNPKLAEAIQYGGHNGVVTIKGFNKEQLASVEAGGLQRDTVEYLLHLRQRWDRMSGQSETMRGNFGMQRTATGEDIAARSAGAREEYIRGKFQAGIVATIRTVAQLMHDHPEVSFPAVTRDSFTGAMKGIVFTGGRTPGQRFEDLSVSIAPVTLGYTGDASFQRRMMQVVEILTGALPTLVAMPFVRVRTVLDDLFASINVPGAADRYLDMDALEMARRLQGLAAAQSPTLLGTPSAVPLGGMAGMGGAGRGGGSGGGMFGLLPAGGGAGGAGGMGEGRVHAAATRPPIPPAGRRVTPPAGNATGGMREHAADLSAGAR